jgi:PII-like signaling protein
MVTRKKPFPPPPNTLLVRIYVTESRARLARVLELLHQSRRIKGLTAFRGVAGFGSSGSYFMEGDDAGDPPMVLEFFDDADSADATVAFVTSLIAPHHIVVIPVTSLPLAAA